MSSLPSERKLRKRPTKHLTTSQIIRRLKRLKPKNLLDTLNNCYLPLQFLFGGSFRDVYHIVGTRLVIKVPNDSFGEEDSVSHSQTEVKWVKRLRAKKYAAFHKYLPRIYYANKHGVVLMRRYYEMENTKLSRKLCETLEGNLKEKVKLEHDLDIRTDNMGRDEKGRPVILDLGLFSG